ncbi:MAG TPA: universal stress protein UspE [Succinivibrionaceae bacterium]|nr:universal stress protein UspE [Succinivibrionaceae bacterium]
MQVIAKMKEFQHILVVIEPRQMRQPALERALAVSRYARELSSKNTDTQGQNIKITAVMPVYDFSWDLTSVLSIEQENSLQNSVIEKHRNWLDAYLRIHAMGYDVEQEVVWSKSIGKTITAIAKDKACDLIIKSADVHGMLDSVIFTPLDWQLLRHSPVPVYVAQDHMWKPTGVIAVALDMSDPADNSQLLLNVRILREAQQLARFTKCQIHLINAVPPVLPPVSIDLPGFVPEIVGDEVIRDAVKTVLAFGARHKIPADNCHIREGLPDEIIPEICRELKPTALFLGTSAHKGLAVAVLGNICEKVIDELDCDVAVTTPKSVIRRIPTSERTR